MLPRFKQQNINLPFSVHLFGSCEEDRDCAGSGTECVAGYCVCADGYHAQDGECSEKFYHLKNIMQL